MRHLRYSAGTVVLHIFLIASVSASNASRIQIEAKEARAAIQLDLPDRQHDPLNLIDSHLSYLRQTEKRLKEYQSPLTVPNLLLDPRRAWYTVVRSVKNDRFFGNPYCDVISYLEKVLGDVGDDCLSTGEYNSAARYYTRKIAVQEALAKIASGVAIELLK